MVQVLSGLWGPWPPGGQEWGGAGALPPSEPQMVLLILSLIALTARMSCKQRSADSKNHTIFKWRWFATVEHNQKNALQALKGIPKICWSTSLRKFSIRKCHLLGCVVSDHFFTGQRWYQQLPLYACSVSSVGPSLILTWSVGRPSDLSGLSNKSKLLVSQSSESGKTLWF